MMEKQQQLNYKKGIELLEPVQRIEAKLVKALENSVTLIIMSVTEGTCLFSLEKRIPRGLLITLYSYLKGGSSEEGVRFFSGDRK